MVVLGRDAASWSIGAGESIMVGRDESANDLILHHPEVSRTHARLSERHGHYVVTDLASTRGVFVNGERTEGARKLSDGDLVDIGPYSLRVAVRPWVYREEEDCEETIFDMSG